MSVSVLCDIRFPLRHASLQISQFARVALPARLLTLLRLLVMSSCLLLMKAKVRVQSEGHADSIV